MRVSSGTILQSCFVFIEYKAVSRTILGSSDDFLKRRYKSRLVNRVSEPWVRQGTGTQG